MPEHHPSSTDAAALTQWSFKALRFGVAAVVLYVLGIIVYGEWLSPFFYANISAQPCGYGHSYTRLREAAITKDVDILFLGSSHAYRSFDTRIFQQHGIRSFNLGTGSQTPLQTEWLLSRYLMNLNPSLVIYEVYPWAFTSDGVESSMDILINSWVDKQALDIAWQQRHIKVSNTLIFRYYRDLVHGPDEMKEPRSNQRGDTYIEGGYVAHETGRYTPTPLPSLHWKNRPMQVAAFERTLAQIEAQGARLLFVQAPVSPHYYQTYPSPAVFDEWISQYGNHVDFNQVVELQDSLHFYDYQHLNQRGVEVFNEALLEYVSSCVPSFIVF